MSLDPQVHVIDDDPDVLQSLSFLLTVRGMPVRTYGSAAQFLKAYADGLGGCVLSEVRMLEMDGIDLLRRVRADGSSLPFIVITEHADVAMAVEAMKEGAMDVVEKPYCDAAITAVAEVGLARWQEMTDSGHEVSVARDRLAILSARELQVLNAVAEGRASKAIALNLGLSVRTVEVHRANILSKLGVETAILAVAMVMKARSGLPERMAG